MKNKIKNILLLSISGFSILSLPLISCSNNKEVKDNQVQNKELKLKYDYSEFDNTATAIGIDYGNNPTTADKIRLIEHLIIPETVNYNNKQYIVKSIAANSFSFTNIKEVTIPKSVQRIGKEAFYFSEITKINIPIDGELKEIWDEAFFYNKIKEFNIPENVKYIANSILSTQRDESAETIDDLVINSYAKDPNLNYKGFFNYSNNPYAHINCKNTDVCLSYHVSTNTNEKTKIYGGFIKEGIKELRLPTKISDSLSSILNYGTNAKNVQELYEGAFKGQRFNIEKVYLSKEIYDNTKNIENCFNEGVEIKIIEE
jgi:hypothetical protein